MQYGEGNGIVRVFVDIRRLTLGSRANLFSYITFTFTCQIHMPYFSAAKVAVTAQVKLKLRQRLTTFPHASRIGPLHSTNFLTLPCTSQPTIWQSLTPFPSSNDHASEIGKLFIRCEPATLVRHSFSDIVPEVNELPLLLTCTSYSLKTNRAHSHTPTSLTLSSASTFASLPPFTVCLPSPSIAGHRCTDAYRTFNRSNFVKDGALTTLYQPFRLSQVPPVRGELGDDQ